MIAVGAGIFFVGYWGAVYGLSQIMGRNYGFLQLGWPSSWAEALASPPPADSGGATAVQTTSPPCPPGYSVVAGKCVQNAPPGSGTNTGYKTKAACQAAAAAAGTKGTCYKSAGGTWYVATAAGH